MFKTKEELRKATVSFLHTSVRSDACLWFCLSDGGPHASGADLAFVLPGGQVAFIELRLSKDPGLEFQTEFSKACWKLGAPCYVATSVIAVGLKLHEWGVTYGNKKTSGVSPA